MTVEHGWAKRVREVLAEAKPAGEALAGRRLPAGVDEAWRRYDLEQAIHGSPLLEQTPRARDVREINRIAVTYGWTLPVARALDQVGAAALGHMQDHELADLAAHMRHLVDCAQSACDPADGLPAR